MCNFDTALIQQALDEVLQGHSFRSSKQSCALLEYIVKHTVDQEENMLKERVIGTEVFGRKPDYDTGNDPVVRSRVAEVRKRLAQHYMQETGLQSELRIEIPSGSYKATFGLRDVASANPDSQSSISAEAPANSAVQTPVDSIESTVDAVAETAAPLRPTGFRKRIGWYALAVALLCGLVSLGIMLFYSSAPRLSDNAFNQFWQPIIRSQSATVIYFGGSYTYHFSAKALEDYRAQHHADNAGAVPLNDIQTGDVLNESSLIENDHLLGFGDTAAVARVASTLTPMGKKYDLRHGSEITVADLSKSPVIIIGGFSNRWTLKLIQTFRYTLAQGGIVDQQQQKLMWQQSGSPDNLVREDYAIISRIPNSETGHFMLLIAGINTFSNQAAADFISDPEKLKALAHTLPAKWWKKNLQFVIHTKVIKEVPVSTDVVATYTW